MKRAYDAARLNNDLLLACNELRAQKNNGSASSDLFTGAVGIQDDGDSEGDTDTATIENMIALQIGITKRAINPQLVDPIFLGNNRYVFNSEPKKHQ